jgi:hypothetical protein
MFGIFVWRHFMVKLRDCAIRVKTNTSQTPLSFHWNNTWFPVENILDCWEDTGCWWEGETEKTFFRVASRKQIFELYREKNTSKWHLYSVYD